MSSQTEIVPYRGRFLIKFVGPPASAGQFFQQTHEGAIKAADVVAYLAHPLGNIAGSVTVVFDNARIHRAKVVQEFLKTNPRLSIVYLPPYTPEFNPVEQV